MSDDEWAFVAPYLTLMDEEALQRRYPLREVFNAVLWMVRAGAPWRLLPTNFPPWPTVYQQARRWLAAGCFEALVHDLRLLLRLALGWAGQPSADKVFSLFEPSTRHTRVRKRGATEPVVECRRQVTAGEIERGAITGEHVLADDESALRWARPAGP